MTAFLELREVIQIAVVLASGDITVIKLGGTGDGDALLTLDEITTLLSSGDIAVIKLGGTGAGYALLTSDQIVALVPGTVTEVSSNTANQLTVNNGTSTPALSIVIAAVANGELALATGDAIYDFVTAYAAGAITSINASNISAVVFGTRDGSSFKVSFGHAHNEYALETQLAAYKLKRTLLTGALTNPPTAAELVSLIGSASTLGEDYEVYVYDSSNSIMYDVNSDGTDWFYVAKTKAT